MGRVHEIMRETGVDFPKAVELLAAEAGVKVAAGRTTEAQRTLALELTVKHLGSYAFPPDETIEVARKLALFIAEG